MVLKNPYGFLIKHFKIIHFVLVLLYVYLAYKVNSILDFYNKYIGNKSSQLNPVNYITKYYIVAVIISIIICSIIYILMRYKKKPRLFYLILIFFYLFVSIMIGVSLNGLKIIYFSVLPSKTVRLYRDLMQIMILFQYLTIVTVLFRAMGFDIKKFNFVKDLEDLGLSSEDEEEIELSLSGNQPILRKIRRHLREFKYYFLENEPFFIIIGVICAIVFFVSVVVNVEVVNKVYEEGETFSTGQYRFLVLNSYITNRDYKNSLINDNDDKIFFIVKMAIGVSDDETTFNDSNLSLEINNHVYSSDNKYAARFSDIGEAYNKRVIRDQGVYLFIFTVDTKYLNKNEVILNFANLKKIRLNPINLDEIGLSKNYKLGDRLDLSDSILSSGYIHISKYELNKEFLYSYEYEVAGRFNTSNISIASGINCSIMHLEIDFEIPSFTIYSFLSKYGKLKYRDSSNNEVTSVMNDRTPISYNGGLYLSVDEDIENATSVWFEIIIRGNKYIYTIK